MGMIKNYIKHFKTITKHKWVVMRLCFMEYDWFCADGGTNGDEEL